MYSQRVIQWATNYIGKYPYWKIYKDKVGSNTRAEGPRERIDTESSLANLREDLELLSMSPGKYVIHLKTEPDSKAGAREMEFEVPYSYNAAGNTNSAVGSTHASAAVMAGGGLMTVAQHEASLGKLAADITTQVKKDMRLEELEKYKLETTDKLKELERLKKEKKDQKEKGFDPTAMLGKLEAMRPILEMVAGMLKGGPQVALSGFDQVNAVPPSSRVTRQPAARKADPPQTENTVPAMETAPAVQTESTVSVDEATVDALNDRLYDAEERMMAAMGVDLENYVIRMEALTAFIENNPGMYRSLEPTILSHHDQYKK